MARARAEAAPEAAEPSEIQRDSGSARRGRGDRRAWRRRPFWRSSFFAYQNDLPSLNLAGRVGHGLADLVVQALGYGAYLLPLALLTVAVSLFRHSVNGLGPARAVAAALLVPCVAILFGLAAGPNRPVAVAGGWVGGFLAAVLAEPFGAGGSFIIVGGIAVLAFIVATHLSLGSIVRGVSRGVAGSLRRAKTVAERAEPAAQQLVRKPKANVKRIAPADDDVAPLIIHERRPATPKKKRVVQEELPFGDERYTVPPLRLLHAPKHDDISIDEDGAAAQLADPRGQARGLRHRRQGCRGAARPGDHDLRHRAGAGREGEPDHQPRRRSRDGAARAGRAHPGAGARQGRGRDRGRQPAARRGRAARADRGGRVPAVDLADADGARQGYRRSLRHRRSGQDAASDDRRRHRQRQVGRHQCHDHEHPLQGAAARGALRHDRPEDARAVGLRGDPAPAGAGGDRSQAGGVRCSTTSSS